MKPRRLICTTRYQQLSAVRGAEYFPVKHETKIRMEVVEKEFESFCPILSISLATSSDYPEAARSVQERHSSKLVAIKDESKSSR